MKLNNRYIFLIVSGLLVVAAMIYLNDLVAYALIAWVLAILGGPIMQFLLQRLRFNRLKIGPSLAALLTLIIYFSVLGLFLALFIPAILVQAQHLKEIDYVALTNALDEPIRSSEQYLSGLGFSISQGELQGQVESFFRDYLSPQVITNFFGSFVNAAGNILIAVFSVVFIAFFFLRERSLFNNFIITLTPNRYEEEIKHILHDSVHMLTRYFGGIVVQIVTFTLLCWIVLSVLGVPNALLIAFFGALMNVIPYLGPLIGGGFGVLITIASHADLSFYSITLPLIIKVIATFGIMQLIDNFLIQPTIFSNSVKAHPLEIFFVILIGAKIGQVPGMILAIPVYTVLRVVARVFLSEFKIVQKLTGQL